MNSILQRLSLRNYTATVQHITQALRADSTKKSFSWQGRSVTPDAYSSTAFASTAFAPHPAEICKAVVVVSSVVAGCHFLYSGCRSFCRKDFEKGCQQLVYSVGCAILLCTSLSFSNP